MLEYMIGTMRSGGKSQRYLRIKSDAEIVVMGDLLTFTRAQEDKVSVYECILGDLIREEAAGGLFYKWYSVESVLVETDHTIQLAAEVGNMAPSVSAASVAFVAMAEAGEIDDVTVTKHAAEFAPWAPLVTYKAGAIRSYEGALFRCNQGHTSQTGWEPPEAASLWVEIADPAEEWPAWAAPIGAHDAYAQGAKVSHNGGRWTSDLDGNVWEPGVYGWTQYAEESGDSGEVTA